MGADFEPAHQKSGLRALVVGKFDQKAPSGFAMGRSGAASATAAWPSIGVRGAWHIFSPSHCWPHQHRPAASMMQVPLPQQRGSSVIQNSMMSAWRHSARHAYLSLCGVTLRFLRHAAEAR